VLWPWADAAAGGVGVVDTVIAGLLPAYRLYSCANGTQLAVGCLEPKFWAGFCQAMGLPELATAGLDAGKAGEQAASRMAEHLATRPADDWLRELAGKDLPVTAVNDISAAREDTALAAGGLLESTPMPDGSTLTVPGPALPALGRTPTRPAPRLGEHNRSVLSAPVDKRSHSDPG
jgi:crotonobetainyl-CoA:carnitine CoA-transferase CaiB-like acyl-CoA transferase